jgi:hypothetical protein
LMWLLTCREECNCHTQLLAPHIDLRYHVIRARRSTPLRSKARLDELKVRSLESLSEVSIGEALHAIGFLRRLLTECGGPELPRQLWFPRSRQMFYNVLSKLFGTSAAHGSCT